MNTPFLDGVPAIALQSSESHDAEHYYHFRYMIKSQRFILTSSQLIYNIPDIFY